MNLTLLLVGARPWTVRPVEAFARVTAAIALLSIEMQVVTLAGIGSLRSLVWVNVPIAIAAWLTLRPAPARSIPAAEDPGPRGRDGATPGPQGTRLPWLAIAVMTLLALVLAMRPLEGADPYHLERVAQILRLGTLAFDPAADIKVNVLASSYELVLADLRQVPVAGPLLLQLHGLVSLAYFTLGVAAIRQWLPGGRRWCWGAVFAAPVLFHQLAFVKNDLYSAAPALVALAWLAVRARTAPHREIAAVSALIGFAIATKWVAFPLPLLMAGTLAWQRPRDARAWSALALGGAAGAVAGGLPYTLLQTARWYGHPFEPLAALGNRTADPAGALVSMARFVISLFDFGQLTRRWWPGRGGWGTTFGAPLVWALVALAISRNRPEVRRSTLLAAIYGFTFAAIYPDADLAHRLIMAPGLLLVAVAAQHSDDETSAALPLRRGFAAGLWLRRGLAAALAISAIQIARSLWLYLS